MISSIKSKKYNTRQDIADAIGIKDISLRYFLFKVKPENMYHEFYINKRNGEKRIISAPNKQLRNIQRKLVSFLETLYDTKICVYGFAKGKSIVNNATIHTKQQHILNIDLKDFFSQIHFGRVRGLFMKPPYCFGKEAATTIAQIACYKGKLPQGAPSSPIISNMICAPLDNQIMHLAKQYKFYYTRYADDITISTNKRSFDRAIVYTNNGSIVLGNSLTEVINRNSFVINESKITLRTHFNRQEVTGLIVNKFPNVRRKYIKELRAMLFNAQKDGLIASANAHIDKHKLDPNPKIASLKKDDDKLKLWYLEILNGKIQFIKQVKGKYSGTYISFANKLNKISQAEIGYELLNTSSELFDYLKDRVFLIEHESDKDYIQGSGFILRDIGLFTSWHVTENDVNYQVFKIDNGKEKILDIFKPINLIKEDKDIDYAVYKCKYCNDCNYYFDYNDNFDLKIGDKVFIAGFPDHCDGNSISFQKCSIMSKKRFHNSDFYTVSGRIVHGASGGAVFDENRKIIGLIKGGITKLSEEIENNNQGFVPIKQILEHFNK